MHRDSPPSKNKQQQIVMSDVLMFIGSFPLLLVSPPLSHRTHPYLQVRSHGELLESSRVGQALGDDLAGEVVHDFDEKLGHGCTSSPWLSGASPTLYSLVLLALCCVSCLKRGAVCWCGSQRCRDYWEVTQKVNQFWIGAPYVLLRAPRCQKTKDCVLQNQSDITVVPGTNVERVAGKGIVFDCIRRCPNPDGLHAKGLGKQVGIWLRAGGKKKSSRPRF